MNNALPKTTIVPHNKTPICTRPYHPRRIFLILKFGIQRYTNIRRDAWTFVVFYILFKSNKTYLSSDSYGVAIAIRVRIWSASPIPPPTNKYWAASVLQSFLYYNLYDAFLKIIIPFLFFIITIITLCSSTCRCSYGYHANG